MAIFERFGLPRQLPSRLWLITLPSAVVSFEKRSDVPKLPETGSRIVGVVLVAAGAGLAFFSSRQPDTNLSYDGPMAPVARRPAVLGGLLGLAGVAFILRSSALLLYAIGLGAAGGTNQVELEEPSAGTLMGRDGN
jgi:hypothetical protein